MHTEVLKMAKGKGSSKGGKMKGYMPKLKGC